MLLSAMLFTGTVGYDNSMMNGLQALPQWKEFMHNPYGAYLGLSNAARRLVPALAILKWFRWPTDGVERSVSISVALSWSLELVYRLGSRDREMFMAAGFFVGLASGFFGATQLLTTESIQLTEAGWLLLQLQGHIVPRISSYVLPITSMSCRVS